MRGLRLAGSLVLALVVPAICEAEVLPPGADLRLGFVPGYLQERVRRIDFLPGGETFVAAGLRGIRSFATEDGAPGPTPEIPGGKQVLDVQVVDAGATLLAVVGSEAYLLDRERGGELVRWGGDDMAAQAARMDPDGELVAVGGQRRFPGADEPGSLVRVFRRETSALVHELALGGRGVESMAFSSDGRELAVASRDAYLRVFDVASGEQVLQVGGTTLDADAALSESDRLDPGRPRLEFVDVAFAPGDDELVGLTFRHAVSVWRRRDGALLRRHDASRPELPEEHRAATLASARLAPLGMTFMAVSADGTRVAVDGRGLELRGLATGEVERRLDFYAGQPTAAAFSPDARSLVAGGTRGVCFRYDVASGEVVGRDREVRGAVATLAIRPGTGEVLVGDFRFLRRWHAETGEPVGAPMEHGSPVGVLAASPDGARALTGGGAGGARLWDLGSGKQLAALDVAGDPVTGAAFLGNERLLVVGRSGTARVFEGTAPSPIESFSLGPGAGRVAFTPGRDRVALVSSEGLRVIRLEDRRLLESASLEGQAFGVAFSPDGRWVFVGHAKRDRVSRLEVGRGWRAPLVLRAPGEDIPTRHRGDTRPGNWEVATTPGGARLVARSAGRALQVWSVSTGKRIGHVEGSVRNEVTGLLVVSEDRAISGAGKVAYRWSLDEAR